DQIGPGLLDRERADPVVLHALPGGLELLRALVTGLDRHHRLGLHACLRRVVDPAGQVAVSVDDAARPEQRFPPSDGRGSVTRTYHRGMEGRKVAFAAAALAGIAAAYGFRRWRPSRIEVDGESMRPTLEHGDWAIAFRARRLHRGDVVVIEHPDRAGFELVKRVTHLPGDLAPDGLGLVDRVWVEGDHPD